MHSLNWMVYSEISNPLVDTGASIQQLRIVPPLPQDNLMTITLNISLQPATDNLM